MTTQGSLMKPPVLIPSQYPPKITSMSSSSSPPDDSQSTEHSSVVGRRHMQRGLLARAVTYVDNAAKVHFPKTSPLRHQSSTKEIPELKILHRDPIVWGDASKRYLDREEENNNISYTSLQDDYDENVIDYQRLIMPREPASIQSTSTPIDSPLLEGHNVKRQRSNDGHDLKKEFSKTTADVNGNTIDHHSTTDTNKTNHVNETKTHSFDTTQQLKSGFFRSIKRHYSPVFPKADERQTRLSIPGSDGESGSNSDISNSPNAESEVDSEDELRDSFNGNMSTLARQKLNQLRHHGPRNIDVSTGLQWIRLELHEMREQDKALFLQLIKLHSTIKELRSDLSGQDFDSYDNLHSAASLWWPRRGLGSSTLPNFSSSDGAQMLRSGIRTKLPLRRGFSLNYASPVENRKRNSVNEPDYRENTSSESVASLENSTSC